jgi:hypothetical protein
LYLFERGLYGYHYLFDDDLVSETLSAAEDDILADSQRYGVELAEVVRRLVDAPNVTEARRMIQGLPRPLARLFAYIYFQAINRSADRQGATLH